MGAKEGHDDEAQAQDEATIKLLEKIVIDLGGYRSSYLYGKESGHMQKRVDSIAQ